MFYFLIQMVFAFEPAIKGLDISQIETSKDRIEQPALATHERMIIPPLGSSVIISGKSGSGKSTLLANLLKDERFYGPCKTKPKGWFDKIFLFSPTANGDDIQKSLNIPSKYVFTDLSEAPELLSVILSSQQNKLDKGGGAHTVSQVCVIFDDVIGDTKFMNTKEFTKCFYQVRHVNCTTFLCTQHFKRVPRICRLQANFVFFFQGSQTEVETIVEDFAPPNMSRNDFRALVDESTRDKFSFLTINMKLPWQQRFRKNLDSFLSIPGEGDQPKPDSRKRSGICDLTDKKQKQSAPDNHSETFEQVKNHIRRNVEDEQRNGQVQFQTGTTRERFDGGFR